MWQREKLLLELRRRGPRWATLLLGGLIVVDVAHSAWLLRTNVPEKVSTLPGVPPLPVHHFDVQQVVSSHLFGMPAAPPIPGDADAANAPDSQAAIALTGIIASRDPKLGFAILGEAGKPGRVFLTGAPVAGAAGGRLFRVFPDRVVLDFSGRLETLRLPHKNLPGFQPLVRQPEPTLLAAAAPEITPAHAADDLNPTPAENLFNGLDAEQEVGGGGADGMVLHPNKGLQRQYGLSVGDRVVAVNGVQITDPNVLADALKTPETSLSLTFVHEGVQQTKTLQLSN